MKHQNRGIHNILINNLIGIHNILIKNLIGVWGMVCEKNYFRPTYESMQNKIYSSACHILLEIRNYDGPPPLKYYGSGTTPPVL